VPGNLDELHVGPRLDLGDQARTEPAPLSLHVEPIDFARAVQLNALWHSTLPCYAGGCIRNQSDLCYAATHGGIVYAVAIWSNPVARHLPQRTWLELRRLAVAPDAPRNTASRMLAVMARLVRRDRPGVLRLVSYHDTGVHTGAIYRAAGGVPTATTRGRQWSTPARRPASQSAGDKQRWELALDEGQGSPCQEVFKGQPRHPAQQAAVTGQGHRG
jgi:hypothetical protein